MRGGEELLKTLWHVALATAAAYEALTAETRPRKFLAGAAAGWHVVAVMDDWKDFRAVRLKEARRDG